MWNWLQDLFRRRKLTADVAVLSDRGLVRADNQDHAMVNRAQHTYCVADGMGGGDGGAMASKIVCDAVGRAAAKRTDFPERIRRIHEALRSANSEIRDYAAKAGFVRQMATTAVVLVIDGTHGDQAVVGSVGDSRLYRFRAGKLEQITRDHTVGHELSRHAPSRAAATGFRSRSLAISHMLTRAVGIFPDVVPEWHMIDVRRGDQFLLCSDGLHDMVSDESIRDVFGAGGDASETVSRLVKRIVAGGAVDNYTLVVVKTGGRR